MSHRKNSIPIAEVNNDSIWHFSSGRSGRRKLDSFLVSWVGVPQMLKEAREIARPESMELHQGTPDEDETLFNVRTNATFSPHSQDINCL